MNKLILILLLTLSSTINASGDVNLGEQKSASCAGCHGLQGNSVIPGFPKLAGQGAEYLIKQLLDFKSGVRYDPIMAGQTATLSEKDIEDISTYYSTQTISQGFAEKGSNIELGEKIYRGGKKKTQVTACIACHGPQGLGIPSAKFPSLASQHAMYLNKQLKAFRQDTLNEQTGASTASRANDYEGMMINFTKSLNNTEIEAISQYLAGLH
jgi:cytochrome c553